MRVLVLSHMYPRPHNTIYGIFIHHQVKELEKQGCKVVVVSPVRYVPFPLHNINKKWNSYKRIPSKTVIEEITVYYPRYVSFPLNIFSQHSGKLMFRGMVNLVKTIWSDFKFDMVHAHVALPDGFAALMLKQKYSVPVVVTIHGADLQSTIYLNKKCKKAVGQVFQKADHIITVSNKLKGIAVDNYGWEEKITTIPNGIYHWLSKGKVKSSTNQKVMLSVSNLIKSKGIDLNLKAFAALMEKHPTLIYKIIGEGPDLNRLKKIVKSLNIPEDRVSFMGRLPNREVVKQMSEADIFSLPSWKEGFGVVYIEAMSQGKPVIACKGEGIEDVIVHKENGFLVEPRNVDSLINTIDYLLSNPEKCAIVGKSAQNTILNNYTWDKNVEKTISVYKHVLNF